MTGTFLPQPVIRAVDASGLPLPGAQMQFYLSGTTTPATVYANASLGTALSNPVVADSGGLFPPIWLDQTVTYRVQLLTAAGSLVRDIDPVAQPPSFPSGSVTASMLASGAAVTNLGFTPLNKAGDTATNLALAFSSITTTSAGYLGTPVNEQDTSYTLALSDAGKCIRGNSGSGISYTVPPNSSVAFPVGTVILARNVGSGVITLTRGSGVTMRLAGSGTSQDVALAQWAEVSLLQEAANTWCVSGTGAS